MPFSVISSKLFFTAITSVGFTDEAHTSFSHCTRIFSWTGFLKTLHPFRGFAVKGMEWYPQSSALLYLTDSLSGVLSACIKSVFKTTSFHSSKYSFTSVKTLLDATQRSLGPIGATSAEACFPDAIKTTV